MSVSDSNTSLLPLASPPIIHRSKMSSLVASQDIKARPSSKKDRCMIPKKRYLYSQGNLQHRPELPPWYPAPPLQHNNEYTYSDVSVAMILANGFEQDSGERSNVNLSSSSGDVEEV